MPADKYFIEDQRILVFRAEDYMYNITIDFAGEKGLLDNVFVAK